MFNLRNQGPLFLVLLLAISACSGGKNNEAETPATKSSSDEISVNKNELEKRFNDITLKLDKKSINAREAGKLVSEILEANQTRDLNHFDYETNTKIYSNFTQSLQDRFGAESESALAFLAEVVKINTLEGYSTMSTVEKEQEILRKLEAVREKSYLEYEFFLANYFLNNKMFESLKAASNETKDEDLTYCRGYLLKFVKSIYEKNSKYPGAFKKYAIWGEVLNECNLAPIFLSSIGQIEISAPEERKAEHLILANILKSKEAKEYSKFNLRFDQKTPAIIQSLIKHTLYTIKAQANPDQIVFDLNSVNNSLIFLEKILASNIDPDQAAQLNFADRLWYNLYLNMHELLNNRAEIFTSIFDDLKKKEALHPFLKSIGVELTGRFDNNEIKLFTDSAVGIKSSVFQNKWALVKDSITAMSYISVLSKKDITTETKKILHVLKNRLDKNIKLAAELNTENGVSSSTDAFYTSLADQLTGTVYVEAGKSSDIDELNLGLQSKAVLVNILAKVTTSQKDVEINLDNVRTGYFDLTPKTENFSLPPMTPFEYKIPSYEVIANGALNVSGKTDFGCAVWGDPPENNCNSGEGRGHGHCGSLKAPCLAYVAYKYTVRTISPNRPAQPEKIRRSQDGIKAKIIFQKNVSKNNIIIFANGENGIKGVKGTDSPLCLSGLYNAYNEGKDSSLVIIYRSQNNHPSILANIGNYPINVEAGLSGEGGDAGKGGVIIADGKNNNFSFVAIGGVGGSAGDPADCSILSDASRKPERTDLIKLGLFGDNGKDGEGGTVAKIKASNEN